MSFHTKEFAFQSTAEVYLELSQTSMMGRVCKYREQFLAVYNFPNRPPWHIFGNILNTTLRKIKNF